MQQIVLKSGILSAMNICKLSARHSDVSAIRPCRSLHEELQRRQHQQLPFGSMTSFVKDLLKAEQLRQEKISRGDCDNLRNYRFDKDFKARLTENSLKILQKQKNKPTGDKDNEGTHRINRFNGNGNGNKLLDLIDDADYLNLKNKGETGKWSKQFKACESPLKYLYCLVTEGSVL